MSEVAIIGIGMHPFGRHEGVSGMEQGAVAVRAACEDAGVKWQDVEFAVGGSRAAGDPDRMVSMLGLTGLQFINVSNGCATGGSALITAYNTIISGAYDLGIAIGFDKQIVFFCEETAGDAVMFEGAPGEIAEDCFDCSYLHSKIMM